MPTTLIIKRFDTTLPMPEYKTKGAVGLDLCARLETVLQPGEIKKIPLNVAVKLPEGYWGMLAARSSMHKKGLAPVNGIGIFDQDYCGNDDEYQGLVINASSNVVTVERGERIMQLLLVPIVPTLVEEVAVMEAPNRGGLGSTGTHA